MTALQSPEKHGPLRQDAGKLSNVGKRGLRLGLVQVSAEILQRRPLELRVSLLRIELDKLTGLRQRHEWDLESGLLRCGQVAPFQRPGESRSRTAFGGHEHMFA